MKPLLAPDSQRGKIFRVVMVLLKAPDMDSDWVDTIHKWWELFGRCAFVQLGPPSLSPETGDSE